MKSEGEYMCSYVLRATKAIISSYRRDAGDDPLRRPHLKRLKRARASACTLLNSESMDTAPTLALAVSDLVRLHSDVRDAPRLQNSVGPFPVGHWILPPLGAAQIAGPSFRVPKLLFHPLGRGA